MLTSTEEQGEIMARRNSRLRMKDKPGSQSTGATRDKYLNKRTADKKSTNIFFLNTPHSSSLLSPSLSSLSLTFKLIVFYLKKKVKEVTQYGPFTVTNQQRVIEIS